MLRLIHTGLAFSDRSPECTSCHGGERVTRNMARYRTWGNTGASPHCVSDCLPTGDGKKHLQKSQIKKRVLLMKHLCAAHYSLTDLCTNCVTQSFSRSRLLWTDCFNRNTGREQKENRHTGKKQKEDTSTGQTAPQWGWCPRCSRHWDSSSWTQLAKEIVWNGL